MTTLDSEARSERCAARRDKVARVEEYLPDYPYFCAAPVGDPRSDCLDRDPILGDKFKVVQFGDKGETGWSLWLFPSEARRDAFVRRYKRARHVKNTQSVTRPRRGWEP